MGRRGKAAPLGSGVGRTISYEIPYRWEEYPCIGDCIPGFPIICFKTPIMPEALENCGVPFHSHFTPAGLLHLTRTRNVNICLIIDLTATNRFYHPGFFMNSNVEYHKIPCKSYELPSEQNVLDFFRVMDKYMTDPAFQGRNCVVGVHCDDGVNITGYMVCRYIIQRFLKGAKETISLFEGARGIGMESGEFITNLIDRENDSPPLLVEYFAERDVKRLLRQRGLLKRGQSWDMIARRHPRSINRRWGGPELSDIDYQSYNYNVMYELIDDDGSTENEMWKDGQGTCRSSSRTPSSAAAQTTSASKRQIGAPGPPEPRVGDGPPERRVGGGTPGPLEPRVGGGTPGPCEPPVGDGTLGPPERRVGDGPPGPPERRAGDGPPGSRVGNGRPNPFDFVLGFFASLEKKGTPTADLEQPSKDVTGGRSEKQSEEKGEGQPRRGSGQPPASVTPAAPSQPSGSGQPSVSVTPAAPSQPSGSGQPSVSVTPAAPSQPSGSGQPYVSVTPAATSQPSGSGLQYQRGGGASSSHRGKKRKKGHQSRGGSGQQAPQGQMITQPPTAVPVAPFRSGLFGPTSGYGVPQQNHMALNLATSGYPFAPPRSQPVIDWSNDSILFDRRTPPRLPSAPNAGPPIDIRGIPLQDNLRLGNGGHPVIPQFANNPPAMNPTFGNAVPAVNPTFGYSVFAVNPTFVNDAIGINPIMFGNNAGAMTPPYGNGANAGVGSFQAVRPGDGQFGRVSVGHGRAGPPSRGNRPKRGGHTGGNCGKGYNRKRRR